MFKMAEALDITQSDTPLLEALNDKTAQKTLVQRRAVKRANISKTLNKLVSDPPNTPVEINFYKQKLHSLLSETCVFDNQIEEYMISNELWSEGEHLRQAEISETYSDKVQMAVLELESLLNVPTPVTNVPFVNNHNSNTLPKLKLPQIEFPTFDGRPEKFRRFIDSLECILDKFNLTSFEKYSYLLQQLSGPPRTIVESVSDDSLTYEAAKALLESAFSDKTVQQFSVIRGISDLKLNSKEDFFSWISEVRQLSSQVERLDISSSLFMQYFVWENMSDEFKKQFIAVTNCARPSLDNIINSAFEVERRIKTMSSKPERKPCSSVTLATEVNHVRAQNPESKNKSNVKQTVSDTKASCALCKSLNDNSDSQHKIFNCHKFSTPHSKLAKLKELGGCIRCGWLGHQVNDCNFKFNRKCSNCKSFHAHFLCTKNNKGTVEAGSVKSGHHHKKSSDNNIQTSSCATEVIVMQSFSHKSDMLLPTLTTTVRKSNFKGDKDLRTLYDTASQSTFISEKILSKVKHKVLRKNVHVKILGINNSKSYTTKIVELECKLGSKSVKISAVVVPQIDVKLSADNMSKIINEFSRKNIDLADAHLTESSHIDILLGADQAHLLPIQSCRFGNTAKPSLVYYCQAGVMLIGSAADLINNFPHLGLVEGFIDKFNASF